MHLDGDKLIQTQIESNGRKSTHVREFTDKLLTVVNVTFLISRRPRSSMFCLA